jgi:hypothetical protein
MSAKEDSHIWRQSPNREMSPDRATFGTKHYLLLSPDEEAVSRIGDIFWQWCLLLFFAQKTLDNRIFLGLPSERAGKIEVRYPWFCISSPRNFIMKCYNKH